MAGEGCKSSWRPISQKSSKSFKPNPIYLIPFLMRVEIGANLAEGKFSFPSCMKALDIRSLEQFKQYVKYVPLGVKPGTRPEPETRIFGQILWNRNPTSEGIWTRKANFGIFDWNLDLEAVFLT